MKSQSSQALSLNVAGVESFGWQSGYGVVSVGMRRVPDVMRYIREQRERHDAGRLTRALEITEYEPVDDGFDDPTRPPLHRPARCAARRE